MGVGEGNGGRVGGKWGKQERGFLSINSNGEIGRLKIPLQVLTFKKSSFELKTVDGKKTGNIFSKILSTVEIEGC